MLRETAFTLIFADERYRFSHKNYATPHDWQETGAGHRAPQLLTLADEDTTARVTRNILRKIIVYQFHNTSDTTRIADLVTCKLDVHDVRVELPDEE